MPDEYSSLNGIVFNVGITVVTIKAYDTCGNVSSIACSFDLTVSQCSLPVKLISFTGKSTEAGNVLDWQTNSEKNFSHFEVEKSIDAKSFKQISKIVGKGDSKEKLGYTYIDSIGGGSYYRLKMVDSDGSSAYSTIIHIIGHELADKIGEFYPNPIEGQFSSININSSITNIWTISYYDLLGKLLFVDKKMVVKGNNEIKVDSRLLEKGVNIISFESPRKSYFRKIIK